MLPVDADLARLRTARTKLESRRFADLTLSGYGYDWRAFEKWAKTMDLPALPATSDTVSLYLTDLLDQGKKVTTAWRKGSAIAHYHREAGHSSPFTVESYRLLLAVRKTRLESKRQMQPLLLKHVRQIAKAQAKLGTPLAIRDRAIILVGFLSALRRSSLVALNVADIEFVSQGLIIHVVKEKQDQQGKGRLIGIPKGKRPETCAVRALAAWLALRGTWAGPLFPGMQSGARMKGEAINKVVKRWVKRIGLNPKDRWAAHSLRAGLVTAAAENNCNEFVIRAQTGHRSNSLQDYFRRTNLFKANACYGLL